MSEHTSRVDSAELSTVSLTVGAAVAGTAATAVSPYGYAEAQANDIVTRVNQLIVDVTALKNQVAAIRSTLID